MGGLALVLAAVLFIAVFSYLAATFHYPDVLDGPADQVLPNLLALGPTGRAVWALYGLIPLLLIPTAAGTELLLAGRAPGRARAATLLAYTAALTMMLGLLRWPTLQWALATAYTTTPDPTSHATLAALFDGFNLYFGNYLGEFVGELALNLFFLLTALATRGDARFPRWTAPAGVVAALLGLIALWRNVTPAVAMVAEVENSVLPVWMMVFGGLLVRAADRPPSPIAH
ncbi:MAG: DUF4386 family protein [Gemmatimonadetes bacterium]|nr:DUF4386 family protein [Gemmatimonadota bacterium]